MQPRLNEIAEFAERKNLRVKTTLATESLKNWLETNEQKSSTNEHENFK